MPWSLVRAMVSVILFTAAGVYAGHTSNMWAAFFAGLNLSAFFYEMAGWSEGI